MCIEITDEMFRVRYVDAVLTPRLDQPNKQYPFAGSLQPPKDNRSLARLVRLLEHPSNPIQQIFEMLIVVSADDFVDMITHQAPVALCRLDRKPGPQVPAIIGRFASRIENNSS